MLLALVVFPAVVYCLYTVRVLGRSGTEARKRSLQWLLALAAASMTFLLVLVSQTGAWRERTQIAWVGVAGSGKTLHVGGDNSERVIGWPHGHMQPAARFTRQDDGHIGVNAWGGEGFVLSPEGKPLNGQELTKEIPIGPYRLRVTRDKSWFRRWRFNDCKWDFQVADDRHGELLKPEKNEGCTNMRAGVVSLSLLIDKGVRRMRAQAGDANAELAGDASDLADWAQGVRLLLTEDDRAWATWPGQPEPAKDAGAWPEGTKLKVRWTREMLTLELNATASAEPNLVFQAPYRQSSPLPPADDEAGTVTLTVAGHLLPDKKMFLLPLSAQLRDWQSPLQLSGSGEFQPNATNLRASSPPASAAKAARTLPVKVPTATSAAEVDIDHYHVFLETLRDVPSAFVGFRSPGLGIVWFVLFAFALFATNAFSLYKGRSVEFARRPLAVTYTLGLVLWTLLSVRVVLAFRYTLNPASVDPLGIAGVFLSLAALCVVPAGLLLVVNFALRHEGQRQWKALMWLCLAQALAPLLVRWLVPALWPQLDIAAMSGARPWNIVLTSLLLGAAGCLLAYVASPRIPGQLGMLVRDAPDNYAMMEKATINWWAQGWPWALFVLGIAATALLWLLAWVSHFRHNVYGIAKEVVLAVVQLLALFVLLGGHRGSLRKLSQGLNDGTWGSRGKVVAKWLLLAALFLAGPFVVASAVFFRDAGGVYASLAMLLPCFAIMLRRRSLGVFATALIVISFTTAVVAGAMAWDASASGKNHLAEFARKSSVSKRPYMRLTLWLEHRPDVIEAGVPMSEAYSPDAVPDDRQLNDGDSHLWANRRMIEIGGVRGVGFGMGRPEKATIPLETVQADSTYAFYLANEYGAIGGTFVLLAASIPVALLALQMRARRNISTGFCLAFVIAGALFLESGFQVLMNMGVLPLTGRCFPLLVPYSFSDLSRWSVLLPIMAVLLLWDGEITVIRTERSSLVRTIASRGVTTVWLTGLATLLAAPLIFIVLTRHYDQSHEETPVLYTRDAELDALSEKAREYFWYDCNDHALKLKSDLSDDAKAELQSSMLQQEVERFNALQRPSDDTEGIGRGRAKEAAFDGVHSRLQFVQEMERLRDADAKAPPLAAPVMLRVECVPDGDDASCTPQQRDCTVDSYVIRRNRAARLHIQLDTMVNKAGLPTLKWRDGDARLISASWVNGEWFPSSDDRLTVPWLKQLSARLVGSSSVQKRVGDRLSLDRDLQNAAQAFVATHGKDLHEDLIMMNGIKAPPRVALSILRVPSGEVVALGGWPRPSPDEYWRDEKDANGVATDILPPELWLSTRAPQDIGSRIAGERNFEAQNVGSSSKPVWAAAALAVNPGLAQLETTNTGGRYETRVFGQDVGHHWGVETAGGWCNFACFLARSDNRYQVDLNFLALAPRAERGVVATTRTPISQPYLDAFSDSKENAAPLRFFPNFSSVGMSTEHARRMRGLAATGLAQQMRAHYDLRIGRGAQDRDEPKRAIFRGESFWTGNEDDDKLYSAGDATDLEDISPAITDLELDKIDTPRKFITLLLGGDTNRWSNVELPSAVYTALSGAPLVPHITMNSAPMSQRLGFQATVTKHIQDGMAGVINPPFGTARWYLKDLLGTKPLEQFMPGYVAYAKTGTLGVSNGPDLSRIVIALIKWQDSRHTVVQSGIVLSLYIERAGMARRHGGKYDGTTASMWMNQFLSEPKNKEMLARLAK